MSDNINFKNYWKKQAVETPNVNELIKKATKYKRKTFVRLIAVNIALLVTSVLIGFIWYYYQPEFITTKIGIILCILDMLIYLVFQNTLAPLLLKKEHQLSIKDQLGQLKKLKEKQHFQQTTLLNIYFIILYLGLSLYMFEYTSRMTPFWAIFSYGILLVWISLNAFYFRPKEVKKQQDQLKQLIIQLNKIKEQLHE